MSLDSLIVKCTQCGAKNRVPANRVKDKAICGRCRGPLSLDHRYPDHPVNITDGTFGEEVLNFPGSTAVFVWSPSCGYCRRMLPLVDQLSSDYAGRIKFSKIINEQSPLTSSRYNIQGVPTLLFFKNGKQVDRTVGALPKEEVEKHLNKLL